MEALYTSQRAPESNHDPRGPPRGSTPLRWRNLLRDRSECKMISPSHALLEKRLSRIAGVRAERRRAGRWLPREGRLYSDACSSRPQTQALLP